MDSICSAVKNSLSCDIEHSTHKSRSSSLRKNSYQQQRQQSPSNNLKVHLEIGRRRPETHHTSYDNSQHQHNTSTTTATTAERYMTSRKYKGMIFPPPNREEAEKVCSYIEQQVMNCQKRRQTYRDKHRLYHSDETSLSHKSPRVVCRRCLARHNDDLTKDHRCSRTHTAMCTHAGEERLNAGVLITTKPLIHASTSPNPKPYNHFNRNRRRASCDVSISDHSLSPTSSLSGSNSPFSSDDMVPHHQNNRTEQKRSANSSSSRKGDSLRFRHLCLCHRKPPKLECCDNIYAANSIPPRRRKSIDNGNLNGNTVNTTAPTTKLRRCHSPPVSTTMNSSQNTSSNNSSVSSDAIQSTKFTEPSSNDHRKKFRRHAPTKQVLPDEMQAKPLSSSTRPEVWPGRASSLVAEQPASQAAAGKTKTTEHLCFCKRMMGSSYACNH